MVPIGVAFRAFQKLDENGQGFLRFGTFVDGLLRYPKLADELGMLSRSMREDARELIYKYMYGSTTVRANREVDMVEFVRIFSGHELGRYLIESSALCKNHTIHSLLRLQS